MFLARFFFWENLVTAESASKSNRNPFENKLGWGEIVDQEIDDITVLVDVNRWMIVKLRSDKTKFGHCRLCLALWSLQRAKFKRHFLAETAQASPLTRAGWRHPPPTKDRRVVIEVEARGVRIKMLEFSHSFAQSFQIDQPTLSIVAS